jgi:hypothetical protein
MVALGTIFSRWTIAAAANGYWGSHNFAHCDLSGYQLALPDAQLAVLGKPNSSHPSAIGVAFGVQNYTCSVNNNFTSAGAVAELYDISCLYQYVPNLANSIQEHLYDAWTSLSPEITVQQVAAAADAILTPNIFLADHYFVPNPSGTGISPVWDFRRSKKFQGNQNAFLLGASVASVAAPEGPSHNINWLRIRKVAGEAADEVYRIDTVGGPPPTSCTHGQDKDISVKYTSLYVFYGGLLAKS